MFRLAVTPLSQPLPTPGQSIPSLVIYTRWVINWYHRSGGLKRNILIGTDNNYVTNFSFELNQKGCGAGSVTLAYIDFPIDADDYVNILFNNVIIYTGIVEVRPDIKGGIINLIPMWQRLQERMFAAGKAGGYIFGAGGDSAASTVFTILKTVLTDPTYGIGSSGILWNDALVVTGSSATYSATYIDQLCDKIIDDLVTGRLSNKYWGVNAGGYFFVTFPNTNLNNQLFYDDYPAYTDIEVTTDYSGIESTRYQVYAKVNGASGTTNIGAVGYSGWVGFNVDFSAGNIITLTINGVALSSVTYASSNANTYSLLKTQILASYPSATVVYSATAHYIYMYLSGTIFAVSGSVSGGSAVIVYSFPQLPVETTFREKEDRLTIPDILPVSDALNYAYALLKSFVPIQTIKVNNVNLDLFQPVIGNLIQIQDRDEKIMNTLINCDTASGWSDGVTQDAIDYVEGSGSIKFTVANIGDYAEYAFGTQQFINLLEKIGFMAKSVSKSGLFLSVKIYQGYTETPNACGNGICGSGPCGIGDGSGDGSMESVFVNPINVSAVNIWYYFDFPITQPITRIRFECTSAPGGSTVIKIDRIQAFQTYRSIYTENIVQANYSISPENEQVSMQLKTYDVLANKTLLRYDKKIKIMETSISSN